MFLSKKGCNENLQAGAYNQIWAYEIVVHSELMSICQRYRGKHFRNVNRPNLLKAKCNHRDLMASTMLKHQGAILLLEEQQHM